MIKLDPKCITHFGDEDQKVVYGLPQDILFRLVVSEDFKTALSCIEIVACETKASLPVTRFELNLVSKFIKHCLRTTFPEFR